jgi:hypothetical protein
LGSGTLPAVVELQPPNVNPVFTIGDPIAGLVRLPTLSGKVMRIFAFCNIPMASGAYPDVAPLLEK